MRAAAKPWARSGIDWINPSCLRWNCEGGSDLAELGSAGLLFGGEALAQLGNTHNSCQCWRCNWSLVMVYRSGGQRDDTESKIGEKEEGNLKDDEGEGKAVG